MFGYHNWGWDAIGIWLTEARDAVKYPENVQDSSLTKNSLALNVSSAVVEKNCSTSCLLIQERLFEVTQVNSFFHM
jgi:hypothetical protein